MTFTEPDGWESAPEHCADRAEAERLRDATNALSPIAAARREWTISPCACGGA